MLLKQIFSQNAHWQINKEFAKSFGIDCAILISDLVDKWIYFECQEWFFNTYENIENDTTLSKYQSSKAIKILVESGFLDCKVTGVPPKLNFKINENQLLNFFTFESKKTSLSKVKKLNNQKLKNLTNINKNKDNKNKEIKINNNTNNIPDQNFSNFDGSQKKEGVVKKKEDSVYHKVIDLYYNFHKEKTGAVCVITSKDGKKIKELIKFCELNAKQKKQYICGAELDNAIVYAIKWLFSNYDKWGNQFHKSIKLEMIVSNLSDIINNIKNGTTTNKQQQRDSSTRLEDAINESQERLRALFNPKKE